MSAETFLGFCGETESGSGCDLRAQRGSWNLRMNTVARGWNAASQKCLAMCSQCAPCRFISLSLIHLDCSWFAACNVDALDTHVAGFRTLHANSSLIKVVAQTDAAAVWQPLNATLRGFCDFATYDGDAYGLTSAHGSTCMTGAKGAWRLPDGLQAPSETIMMHWCMQLCLGCERCNFISFSAAQRDCSWFQSCGPQLLGGQDGFRSIAVRALERNLLPAPHEDMQVIHCTAEARTQTGRPTPALIISASEPRYERAAKAVRHMGFSARRTPAIFLNEIGSAAMPVGCLRVADLGLRMAMRGAWKTIARRNQPMVVFEDDIQPARGCGASDAAAYLDRQRTWADVAYLGACGSQTDLYCTHAIWVSPVGARKLLSMPANCTWPTLDTQLHFACSNNELLCAQAPRLLSASDGQEVQAGDCDAHRAPGNRSMRHRGLSCQNGGFGLFMQDRYTLKPHLSNDPTADRILTLQ